MTLHIVSCSPWHGNAFAQCLRVLRAGDALLLAGDGVNALLPGTEPARALESIPGSIQLHALAEDCARRGVSGLPGRIREADYEGFVALACAHERSVSWF